MNIRKLSLYIGVALVIIATVMFLSDSPSRILGTEEPSAEQNIEAYAVARNASTRFFDDAGVLSYTFKSTKLSHFRPTENEEDSYTSVEEPDIIVFSDAGPWHLHADTARVSSDQIITLRQNVALEQRSEEVGLTRFTTSELILDVNNKRAHTSKAVTIDSPLGELTALGMEADMSLRRVKLLSQVRGRHKPQKLNP